MPRDTAEKCGVCHFLSPKISHSAIHTVDLEAAVSRKRKAEDEPPELQSLGFIVSVVSGGNLKVMNPNQLLHTYPCWFRMVGWWDGGICKCWWL